MIPRLDHREPVAETAQSYARALHSLGFEGEIQFDDATRAVLSTDNSIYQVYPQVAVFPMNHQDLIRIARAAHEYDVTLYPRGGGTGTNAQSLGAGIVVDTSKHMNAILEINVEERWARVQCGAVKDHLNAEIRKHGLFFAPDLSTSNRATIGGMVSTDASGQGSVRYGKTRDHVIALKAVLLTGEEFNARVMSDAELDDLPKNSAEYRIGNALRDIHDSNRDEIAAGFPELNRCLTGYDLKHLRTDDREIDLNAVLCGSEGTLAFISEAVINLEPLPTEVALVAVQYESFMDALFDARELMKYGATSIETVDSKVLNLAMKDFIWDSVAEFFPQSDKSLQGINLVEFTDFDAAALQDKVDQFSNHLQTVAQNGGRSFAHATARGRSQVSQVWAMRKRAVGLLGGVEGTKKAVAFVEDTCVPPENLAPYISEFRELLDEHDLDYGMFGHVDAGVLHVRPLLDLKTPESMEMVRKITDEVVSLTKKYHGLLWGEHGKGVRSEYAPLFFGDLYPAICQVKALFDPLNRLNPGKIAGPSPESALLKIDEVPTRGANDRRITPSLQSTASTALLCNGNGACHNYDPDDRMCPSWKATRDRRYTPKGRAGLMREWVTRLADYGLEAIPSLTVAQQILGMPARILRTLNRSQSNYDFNHEVFEAMSTCLACKSCTGQCPIKVSVPTFRSHFLSAYYTRYSRPLKDWIVGTLEYVIPIAAQLPSVYNRLVESRSGKWIFARLGLVDSPSLSGIDPHRAIAEAGFQVADLNRLRKIKADHPERFSRQVVIVQDAFTSYFETSVVVDLFELLKSLELEPSLMPFHPNGKPLHVHGFLDWFKRLGESNAKKLRLIEELDVPMIGLDPSMTMTYRSEYREAAIDVPQVELVQEFISRHLIEGTLATKLPVRRFRLFGHCTEATNAKESLALWKPIFAMVGQSLEIESVGCCGMAGTYGHERANLDTSKTIYGQSWKPKVESITQPDEEILATGYSCRSQVRRLSDQEVRHPVSALRAILASAASQQRA
ncbi:MAG: D-2-hydroxyglutarate dehydrogenase YdiJ [Litorivicinaceae bacterium]